MADRIQLNEPGRPAWYRRSKGEIVAGTGIIELTKGYVAEVDAQFVEAVCRFGWCYSHGYAERGKGRFQGPKIYLHHFILDLAGVSRSHGHVDHINRNPLDNRLTNLRVTTRSVNQCNRGLQSNNTSGHRGVYLVRGKYSARLKRNGVTHHLGVYATVEEAALVYDLAALAHTCLSAADQQRAS